MYRGYESPQASVQDLFRTPSCENRMTARASYSDAITIGCASDFVITPVVRDLRRRFPDAEIRGGLRQDLTAIPIEGIEPCQVVVVTRAGTGSRLVAAFRESAMALLTPPDSLPS
jgi:hypothetical protein